MKWSDWPKMYKSIWAKSGWRLTTFTCRGHSGNHKLAGLSFRSHSRSLGLKARKAFVCETYLTLSTLQFTLSVHDNNQVWLHSCLEFLLLEVQNYSFYVSLYGGNVSTTKKKNTILKYNGVRFTCSFQIFYRPIDYICKKISSFMMRSIWSQNIQTPQSELTTGTPPQQPHQPLHNPRWWHEHNQLWDTEAGVWLSDF